MVSASAQVSIPRFDERLLVSTLAELIRKWQLLTFDTDGVLVHDGEHIEGLRLVQGRHHQKDARYLMVFAPDETEKSPDEPEVDEPKPLVLAVVAATPDEFAFSALVEDDEDGRMTLTFTIANPTRPSKVIGVLEAKLPDTGWLMRGPVLGGAAVDLAAISSNSPRSNQAVAHVKHRHGRASAEVAIAQPNSREWVLQVTARVRGGGLLRPLMAMAGPLVRGKFRAELQKSMDKLAEKIAEQNIGTPTPSELADRAFDGMTAGLARVVSSEPQRS